jgi:hypothetical protein
MSTAAPTLTTIFEQYPALADAERPRQPLTLPDGAMSRLHPSELFREVAHRISVGRYVLRAPAASTQGLCGPFRGVGDCLSPVSEPGDLKWVDPKMSAEDGDLVLVGWHPRVLAGIVKRGSRDADWLAMYGHSPGPIATKMVKHCGGEIYLTTRESALELGANKILGVVRKIYRPTTGRFLYEDEVASSANTIGANAATQTTSNLNFGPTTHLKVNDTSEIGASAATDVSVNFVVGPVALGFVSSNANSISYSAVKFGCTAIVTCTFDASMGTGPIAGQLALLSTLLGIGSAAETTFIPGDTTSRHYALQCEFAYVVGDAPTIALFGHGENSSPNPLNVSNIRLQVEFIKR